MRYRFNFIIFIIGLSSLSQVAISKENISKADLTSKALRGNVEAQYNLCRFLHAEGSDDFAIGWCEKATMEGNDDAAMLLAWLSLHNSENNNDIKKGYMWLSVALAQKYNFSAFNEWKKLSVNLRSDRKSSKRLNREINSLYKQYVDPKESRDLVELITDSRVRYMSSLKKSAANGDSKSQALLGVIYEYGGDLSAALKWYRSAAENGYIDAQSYIGRSSDNSGVGKLLDNVERYSWLYLSLVKRYNYVDNLSLEFIGNRLSEKEIEQAKKNAQNLYSSYADNADLEPLIKQSEEKYIRNVINSEKGANSNKNNIKSYKSGLDILTDNSKSLERTVIEAQQGDIRIQYSLGYMYAQGIEFPQDINKSIKWYKKAALQGFPPAQYALGQAYFNDINKNNNKVTAYAWLDVSSRQGNDKAGVMRDIIAKSFDKEEKRLANILSRKYYRLYVEPFQKAQ